MNRILKRIGAHVRAFARSKAANVAMMFGLALVPITIAAGVGLDYARASLAKSQMSDALDAAALAIGSTNGLPTDKVQGIAQQYFNANYKGDLSGATTGTDGTKQIPVTATYDPVKGSVTLNISNYQMDTAVLKAVGIRTMPVSTSSTVVWGQTKLWVALVLDNSGSMASSGKMSALISASQQLLTTLQGASSTDGDVEVGIVPFTNDVNAGTGISSGYIDWSNWNLQLDADVPDTSYGLGDGCPYSYGCRIPATMTKASSSWTIPSSGSTKGYVCPWSTSSTSNLNGTNSHYYMGCFTTTSTSSTTVVDSGSGATCGNRSSSNCSCTGSTYSSGRKCTAKVWKHASWVPETNHALWQGCFTDRTKTGNIDTSNTQPSGTSAFTADNSDACPDATISPLGYDWTSLNTQIGNMKASGSTNQAIGVAHGWQMLTPGAPYGTPTVPPNTTRYMILLSDGLNTQDRWYGNGLTEGNSQDQAIDTRMNTTCTNAKADGIIIYTLYVNINNSDGDSQPLEDCASDSTKFFTLTSASQISTAFATIAAQITNVRVSK